MNFLIGCDSAKFGSFATRLELLHHKTGIDWEGHPGGSGTPSQTLGESRNVALGGTKQKSITRMFWSALRDAAAVDVVSV